MEVHHSRHSKPIISADFLSFYSALIDVHNKRLLDDPTSLTSLGKQVLDSQSRVTTARTGTKYQQLLQHFQGLINQSGLPASVKHSTEHHIHTTPGPPVSCRPRRLAPDKHKISRNEFDTMIRLGIARPSKSAWTAPVRRTTNGDPAATTEPWTAEQCLTNIPFHTYKILRINFMAKLFFQPSILYEHITKYP